MKERNDEDAAASLNEARNYIGTALMCVCLTHVPGDFPGNPLRKSPQRFPPSISLGKRPRTQAP
jgi:hypothetical protein